MRVYLPTTLVALPGLVRDGRHAGGSACAVTPALREWYANGDEEELEYAALSRAARRSIELLADEVTAPRRRVVIAADVDDADVRTADLRMTAQGPGEADGPVDPAEVEVLVDVPLRGVTAVHVDDVSTVPLVRAALVDPEDETVQDDLEGVDLLWYATQEIDQLLPS
ncbi:MAG TPA: hypothetical protein VLR26_03765 [Frankiaceae bacterium]|nr:hypothetical protein [Frankiaceae bacterium]